MTKGGSKDIWDDAPVHKWNNNSFRLDLKLISFFFIVLIFRF